MIKLCFDYGHGGKDPGASYRGRRESDDVLRIGRQLAQYLRGHGITVDETRTSDRGLGLWERGQFENKDQYDYFISFHRNAFRPELARGVETYIYKKGSPKAYALARDIQRALTQIGFRDRGVKKGDCYVLGRTRAPALLVELGFIDHTKDNQLFDSKNKEIVTALAQVILGHCS